MDLYSFAGLESTEKSPASNVPDTLSTDRGKEREMKYGEGYF
jgi:hypothetical protein